MTFRQSVLALAAPALSVFLIGCQPPLEEKAKPADSAPASGAGTPSTSGGAANSPSSSDATKPADSGTTSAPAVSPSVEAPKVDSAPAPTDLPKKDETPKS